MILVLFAAAAAAPDCNKLPGAVAKDECLLKESLALDPPPNCFKRTTQFDMNICSFRDYLRSDIELNHTWNAVVRRLKGQPKIFDTVLVGQRAWLSYRDKQCDVWAQLYSGGTIVPLTVNSCLIDITKFRTKELSQFVDNK